MSTYTVGSITWKYYLNGTTPETVTIGTGIGSFPDNTTWGNATTSGTALGDATTATNGAITIPATLGLENYPVTNIGVYAFFECNNIKSVEIPNTVTSIGDQAFYGCRLTTLTISNNVTYIGSQAFMKNTLTSVTLGSSVNTIGGEAFRINPNLTSINIPPSVTTFGTAGSGIFDQTSNSLVITMNTRTINGTTYTSPTTTDISFFGNPSVTLIAPPPLTMTIASSTPGITSGSTTNNESITLTFTSSAPTTDFILTDITVNGGTLTNLVTSDNIVYTATLTPTGSGTMVTQATTVNVSADKFTDDDTGYTNTESNVFTWTYDNDIKIKIHTNFTISDGTSSSVFTTADAIYTPTTFAEKLTADLGTTVTVGGDETLSDSTPYYRMYLQFANAVTLTGMPKYIFNIPFSDFSVKAGGQVNFRNVNLDAEMTITTTYNTISTTSTLPANNYFINDFVSTIETDLGFTLSYDEPNNRIEFVGLTQDISLSITSTDTTVFDTTITEITTTANKLPFLSYGQPDPTIQQYIENGITVNEYINNGYTIADLLTASVVPDWAIDPSANRLNQTYVKDFIDISGSVVLRNNADMYITGNIQTSGNVLINNQILEADLSLNYKLFVGGDVSMNGNVTVGGHVTVGGTVVDCSFVDSSIPASAFIGDIPDSAPDYTQPTILYEKGFNTIADVSMNANVQISNLKVDGNIQFSDGTIMDSYDDNKSIFYNFQCIDTSYSLIPNTYVSHGAQGILCSDDGKYLLSLYGANLESGGSNPYYNTSNYGYSGLFLSKNYGITYSLVTLPVVATDPSGGSLTANNLINSSYGCAAISSTGKYMMCNLTGTGQAQSSWQNSVIAFSSDYGETWSTQFIWRFLKEHSLVNNTAIVMGLAVNTDASVIAVSLSTYGTYISTDYMNSFSVRNSMPTSNLRCRLDILGNDRILIPYADSKSGIRIYDLSGNSKYSNTELIPHSYMTYSASRSGNIIAVVNTWNNSNSMPPYCYLIATDDGTTYTTTNLTPSGVESTALPGIYNGTTVIAGHTTLSCMVSPSGKYVLFGPGLNYNYPGMVLDLISYPFYYSDNYGKDANQEYIFTKVTNPPFSRDGVVKYKSTNITENGFIYMQYPEFNADSTFSRKIVRLDFRKFKASTFKSLTITDTLTAGSFSTSSDYRIKNNVTPLDQTITIDQLRPVKYLQTLINKQQYGLIAHELQEYFPDLVKGEKDGEQLQTVNYTGLIALLINEVKRLKQELTELENEVQ